MNLRPSDVDGIVDQINETRESEFWRDPDRPSTKFVPARRKQDPKIVKAKGRSRTAAWRNACDRLGRPEARDIGMAMVTALVMSEHLLDMTEQEVRFVSAALADLEARGFDRAQTLGVLRIGALMREVRIHRLPRQGGMLGGFLLGLTFAAGWTPCIGPQLSAILSVAQDGHFEGLPVMVAYCLGLAVPFMLLAALTDRLQGAIRAVNRHLGVVNLVAGALLLVFGVLLVADRFTVFSQFAVQSPFDL